MDTDRKPQGPADIAPIDGDPRAVLSLLAQLDRQKDDKALQALIGALRDAGKLTLHCAVFDMRVRFRAGNPAEALRAVEAVLSLASDNVEALRTGGRIGNMAKDDPVSLHYWRQLARVSAEDPEAALQVARICHRHGQHAEALEWARQAAERRPGLAEPLQIAAVSGAAIGWPPACDTLFVRLYGLDRGGASKVLALLLPTLDPERLAGLLSLLRREFGDDATLADIADRTYAGWLASALEQELASREIEASAYYRAAGTLRPGHGYPQRALERLSMPSLDAMRAALEGRDFAGAVEHGLAAGRIHPTCIEAWHGVGGAELARGNFAAACDALRRGLELDPRDAGAWLNYGRALTALGDRCAAASALRNASRGPDAGIAAEAEASIAALHPLLVRDAIQAAKDGRPEAAWASCGAALDLRPGDGATVQLRHTLLRQLREQIRDAWTIGAASVSGLCYRFLEKAPGDAVVATILGRTLMKSRSYAEALPVWEGLCLQNPQDGHCHLQVARCCRALNIREKGLLAALTAMRLDPALQEAAELAAHLESLPAQQATPFAGTAHRAAAPSGRE